MNNKVTEHFVFSNLDGGYFNNDYGNTTLNLDEAFVFTGNLEEAQNYLENINETCEDNDNSDSRVGRRPLFFRFELKKVSVKLQLKEESRFPCPKGTELC